jgi:AraC-like DNA-binding protein
MAPSTTVSTTTIWVQRIFVAAICAFQCNGTIGSKDSLSGTRPVAARSQNRLRRRTKTEDAGRQDEPDQFSVRLAGPARNSRQQDDVPSGRALCDDLLNELKSRIGIAGEIRALLLRDITNPPTLSAIAKLLEVSNRLARRQLREQGISFRGFLDELRM